ncbi:hypothetical protein 056SW001B_55 [Bacillus phage 056SW001B]|uniref:Uncharacterized protein n=1 Tax=Bacillus phage 056SW001B TaxID=2601663 RepID=A0A5P8PIM6_9CAUD|nr:hypothetical protein 056SW001B_55 [Bacillus phage 056SW001B]
MSCPCPQCTNMVEHVTYADDPTPEKSIFDKLNDNRYVSDNLIVEIVDDIDELDDELRQVIRELPQGCSTRNKLERIRAKLW